MYLYTVPAFIVADFAADFVGLAYTPAALFAVSVSPDAAVVVVGFFVVVVVDAVLNFAYVLII